MKTRILLIGSHWSKGAPKSNLAGTLIKQKLEHRHRQLYHVHMKTRSRQCIYKLKSTGLSVEPQESEMRPGTVLAWC